jgi:formiminotetrahydrofolate cyclodeaminase
VRINLPYIEDKKFIKELKAKVKEVMAGAEEGIEK